jgi:hypothetical protein
MKVGIVGAEGAKFTEQGAARAKDAIYAIITDPSVDGVCSGECHLGGIDIWAHEIADKLGKPFQPFPPRDLTWAGGYKPRNLQIARWSDKVFCITVDKLPTGFGGMTFKECYHCRKAGKPIDHVKSGGCWTALKCKESEWIVISNV